MSRPETDPAADQKILHVYDDIEEEDNRLPNWWLFTFYIMIVFFAIFWLAYYQFDLFRSDTERIDSVMAEIEDAKNNEQLPYTWHGLMTDTD